MRLEEPVINATFPAMSIGLTLIIPAGSEPPLSAVPLVTNPCHPRKAEKPRG
jgi:hypothetical protein